MTNQEIVFKSLMEHPKTIGEVSRETNIQISDVKSEIDDLRDKSMCQEIKEGVYTTEQWLFNDRELSMRLSRYVSHIEKSIGKAEETDEDILMKSRLDLTQDNPDPTPLLSIDGSPICTKGNFSVVVGLPGSRKSFLCTALGGAFLNDSGFMGIESSNGKGKLLWLDTEQAVGHVARIGRRLHRIAGIQTDVNDDNVIIYMLRPFDPQKRFELVKTAIELHHPDFCVIDGIGDLLEDVNDPTMSSEIITFLLSTTAKYDCHILCVLHCNPNSDKARGHLGSAAIRKAETEIIIKADGLSSLCHFGKTRDITPQDFAFVVSEGLPQLTAFEPKEARTGKNEQLFNEVMPELPNVISFMDLVGKVMTATGIKQDAAKKRVATAFMRGIITKNPFGMYARKKTEEEDEIPY